VTDVLDPRVLAELRESVGGDEVFLAELIDELLDDGPRQLEALRVAVTGSDAESARRAAHTLKGNGRTFGAVDLSDLCLQAETAAADGDLTAVDSRLDAIDAAWDEVRVALLAARDGSG
jgi:HPt (histidine-containing phosphotransfer) domain-containing protein